MKENYLFSNKISQLHFRGCLLALFFIPITLSWGQTTVFSDDFNRGAVVTPLSNGGTPTMTYTTASTAATGTSTTNLTNGTDYTLSLSCGATAAAGRTYVYAPLSTFSSPFNATLSSNIGLVTWTFNLRTNRATALSGFDAGNQYTNAVVLACNNFDFLNASAKGYVVYLTKGTTKNKINIGYFTAGLNSTSGVTSFIGPSAELVDNTNFVSVKVTYLPSTNTWSLYVREDSAAPGDPTTTTTQVGSSVQNTTNTAVAMTHFGYFWNHSNGAGNSNTGRFDNFKVVVNSPTINSPSPSSLSGFTATLNNSSSPQSFSISGQYLTNSIIISSTTSDYEISTASSGTYSSSITLTSSATVAETPIYVRLKSGLTEGTKTGSCTITSTGATTTNSYTVSLSGSSSSTPTISLNTTSIPAFANTDAGSSSVSQSFLVSGVNLNSVVSISAPTNFEVSNDNNSFSSSVSITPVNGAISNVTVYARYSPSGNGSYTGNIIATSVGATEKQAGVSGYLSTFYFQTGSLATNTNWSGTADGTGTSLPTDFSTPSVSYKILASTTTTAAWTVAGAGSKIIVGDESVAPVTLTIASGYPITTTSPAVLDISVASSSGSNILVLQDPVTPTFGTLHAASEVHYQATHSTGTTKTFGKLFVDGSGTTTTFTGTPVIQTSLTVASGSTMATGNNSGNYITINSGASVTINGTFQTQKSAGFTSANQATTSSGGAIQFISSENLTLGSDSVIEYNRVTSGSTTFQVVTPRTDYKNLTISTTGSIPTVTLAGATRVSGVLTVNTNAILDSAGYLTLKSDANGTARVAQVLGTISGNVTVERYIPAKRAWRALTAPVSTTGSIYTNWQEGGTGNGVNGFDIWMPGGINGLTAGGSSNSLLEYNSADNTWTGITATNGSSSMMNSTKNKPFMAFVTGPYGSGNITSNSAATTLRATGSLLTGDQSYTTTAGKYTFIGNPYASPLDLSVMMNTSQNAAGSFEGNVWVWDANASGLNAVGTYNLYNSGTYSNLTSNTAVVTGTQIQSGQAFFVKSTDGATFTIKESHKGTTFSNAVFRINNPAQLLRVGLYKQENNEWSGRDGAMTVILPDANANQSPNKMANGTENVAFVKNGSLFASEHHLPLVANDVLNVRVWRTTAGANYKLKINTEQFASTNLNATLEDLFTNSRTPLNLEGTAVEYPFTVTNDALSTGDRFRIVFQNAVLGTNNPTATGFSIVPNPVTGDSFQVNLGTLATGIYSYSICNAIGQEVEKGTLNNVTQNTNYEVKMSNSATGIYIMKIKGNDNTLFTAKIIKK